MKKIWSGYFLLFSLFVLWNAIACRSKVPPIATPQQNGFREHVAGQRGGKLTYRVPSPPQTFNYLKAADEASLIAAFYLMGGRLVEFDHDAQVYVPGLAESWNRSVNGKSVELVLRDGIKFSDGQPITAEDVAFTFRAVYDERTASPIFRDAMMVGGRQIEIAVMDARRLRLTFPEIVATPESYLSNLAVLPRHILETEFNRGELRNAYSLTADPQTVVTAGAFAAESATPGERVTLKRNPFYWKKDAAGTALPYLDQLMVEVVSDANHAISQLRQGSLDVFDRIRASDYAALRSPTETAQAFDLGPGLNTDHLWFNLNDSGVVSKPEGNAIKQAWFKELRFRRAVSLAVDRQTIASITLQGLASPLYGFVSPGNKGWVAKDLPRDDYNLEKSRILLNDAGFIVRGDEKSPELFDARGNRVELTLIVPTESQARLQMAAVIQEDLSRLGIKLQVAPLEFGEFQRRTTQNFDYDAALLGISVSEPDPASYTNFLRSSSPTHQWHPKQSRPATEWEARMDELIAAEVREPDSERRNQTFHQIQQIMAEQVPVIPIVARHVSSAINLRVRNYRPSVLLPYSLWNAEELFVSQVTR
ncbi:MAG: ABC transporter substrate-binding protein [Acidobacteria bacterium]|nr:ABC transporter substrate-binding protein [Acidobacteriota bacterium]